MNMRTYARKATRVGVDSPLNNHRFVQLLAARLATNIAVDAIHYALLIDVVRQTGSALHTSLLILTFTAPGVFLGMIGGVAADRFSRRMILISVHVARGLACIAFFRFSNDIWAIYLISVTFSAVNPISGPAEYASVPGLIGPHRLTSGHAWLNLMSLAGQAIGIGILAPVLLRTIGPGPVYVTAAILYFAAALLILQMGRLPRTSVSGVEEGSIADVRAQFMRVWRFLRADPPSYMATIEMSVVASAVLVTISVLPAYTEEVLGVSAENTVFVMAPAVVGMAAGLRLVGPLSREFGSGVVVSAGFVMMIAGAFTLVFIEPLTTLFTSWGAGPGSGWPLPAPPAIVLAAMLLAIPVGFANTAVAVAARAVLQERSPPDLQGRVFAAQGVVANLGSIVPLVLGGFVAELFGVRVVMVLVGLGAAVVGVWTRIGGHEPPPVAAAAGG